MLENTDLEVGVVAFRRAREAWEVIAREMEVGPEIVSNVSVDFRMEVTLGESQVD